MKIAVAIIVALAGFATTALAIQSPTGDVEDGQALFASNCTACHGPDTLHVETIEDLTDMLGDGASHPMAGLFDDKQIADLYAYIREASGG